MEGLLSTQEKKSVKIATMHQPGSLFKVAWLRLENNLSNSNACSSSCCFSSCSSSWEDGDGFCCKKHLWRFLLKGEGRHTEVNGVDWRVVWWNGGAFHSSCFFLSWITKVEIWKNGGREEEEDNTILYVSVPQFNHSLWCGKNLNKQQVQICK